MAQNVPLLLRLLGSSITAATRAGKIIRDVMSSGELGIIEKGVNDLQTEADCSAQRCIVASLLQQYPNLNIVGEEGETNLEVPSDWIVTDCDRTILHHQCPPAYVDLKDEDVVVWIDPLDGTSEYTQGLLEHVTVLIGLAIKGTAVGGVIHQPYYANKSGEEPGRTIWGLEGIGVGGFTPQMPPEEKFIITTTRSHMSENVQKVLDALKPDEIIRVGGCGHKTLLLLEGKAHAYVYSSAGCKKWDTCGPEAVLKAAGGHFTDIFGRSFLYTKDVEFLNKSGVVATVASMDHAQLLAQIPADIKETLK